MTDGGALLRAILADPADDTVRLAYADWLQENAAAVPCRDCGGGGRWRDSRMPGGDTDCGRCHGVGTFPDGRAERAEFVRVQIELASMPAYRYVRDDIDWSDPWLSSECKRAIQLRRRERDLFHAHSAAWFDGFDSVGLAPTNTTAATSAVVARGFVAEIRCTTATFLGGECERCGGRGRVYSPQAYSFDNKCDTCHGTGRTEGIAAEVFSRFPVERVTLSDLQPTGPIQHGQQIGYWFYPRRDVPPELWDHLEFDRKGVAAVVAFYHTREAALAALSAACVRYGRGPAALAADPKAGVGPRRVVR